MKNLSILTKILENKTYDFCCFSNVKTQYNNKYNSKNNG